MTPNLILLLLPLCYGAPADVTSLVQTKAQVDAEAETLTSDPFPGKHDIDNLWKVNAAISHLKQFKKDLAIAMDTNSPHVHIDVTQRDWDKVNDYLTMMGVQAREIKAKNQNTHRSFAASLFSRPAKPDVQGLRRFFERMEKNLYPDIEDAIHFVSSDGSICMEGEAAYLRKVLNKLHKSPLSYGFESPNTMLKRSTCRKSGFSLQSEEADPRMCWPGVNVFVSQHPSKENSYVGFRTKMVHKWMEMEQHDEKYTRDALRNVCVQA